MSLLLLMLLFSFNRWEGFPGGSVVKNPPASTGDLGLIPGSGQFPGEGNGNPLQYSWNTWECFGNPTDSNLASVVAGVAKELDTT